MHLRVGRHYPQVYSSIVGDCLRILDCCLNNNCICPFCNCIRYPLSLPPCLQFDFPTHRHLSLKAGFFHTCVLANSTGANGVRCWGGLTLITPSYFAKYIVIEIYYYRHSVVTAVQAIMHRDSWESRAQSGWETSPARCPPRLLFCLQDSNLYQFSFSTFKRNYSLSLIFFFFFFSFSSELRQAEIAAGLAHTCALLADRKTIYCWGTYVSSLSVSVSLDNDFVSFSLVGSNLFGQLGQGTLATVGDQSGEM